MCEPTTILYGAAALAGGYAAARTLTPDVPTPQAPTAPAAPITPPTTGTGAPPSTASGAPTVIVNSPTPTQTNVNAPKPPSIPNIRANNAGAKTGPSASSSSTLLTSPQGVDLTSAQVGKNTLLGM